MDAMDISSSDDESVVEPDIEIAIRDAFQTLSAPTPCPVCSRGSEAKGRYRAFPDFKSLRQHTNERVADTGREMVKVRHLHRELLERIDRLGVATVVSTPSMELASRIAPSHRFSSDPDGIRSLTKRATQRKEETRDVREERYKKRRLAVERKFKLDRATETLRESRRQRDLYHEAFEKDQKRWKDDLMKTQELYSMKLERVTKSIADLDLRMESDPVHKLSREDEERLRHERNQLGVMRLDLERTTQSWKDTLQETEEKERAARKVLEEAKESEIVYEKHAQKHKELEEQSRAAPQVTEEDLETYKSYTSVGFAWERWSTQCQICGGRFRKKSDDQDDTALCDRAALGNCGCLGYCLSCVSGRGLQQCPVHRVPFGDCYPFLKRYFA